MCGGEHQHVPVRDSPRENERLSEMAINETISRKNNVVCRHDRHAANLVFFYWFQPLLSVFHSLPASTSTCFQLHFPLSLRCPGR